MAFAHGVATYFFSSWVWGLFTGISSVDGYHLVIHGHDTARTWEGGAGGLNIILDVCLGRRQRDGRQSTKRAPPVCPAGLG